MPGASWACGPGFFFGHGFVASWIPLVQLLFVFFGGGLRSGTRPSRTGYGLSRWWSQGRLYLTTPGIKPRALGSPRLHSEYWTTAPGEIPEIPGVIKGGPEIPIDQSAARLLLSRAFCHQPIRLVRRLVSRAPGLRQGAGGEGGFL